MTLHDAELTLFEPSIKELEASMSEPYVERALAQAREYELLINELESTPEERSRIVDILDENWGNIKYSEVRVTGRISHKPTEGEEIDTDFYEDLKVISNGFCITEKDMYRDGEHVRTVYKVQHHFLIDPGLLGVTSHEEGVLSGATADIDGVIFELTAVSHERAIAWLTQNYPDLVDEIDQRILNSEGTEADALLALRGMRLPDEIKDDELACNSIIVYLGRSLQLDKDVPYSVKIEGNGHIIESDGSYTRGRVMAKSVLGNILQLSLDVYNEDVDSSYELFVKMSILHQDRRGLPTVLDLPIDTLQDLGSIRASHYGV